MKTRRFALCLATVFLVAIYINIQRNIGVQGVQTR